MSIRHLAILAVAASLACSSAQADPYQRGEVFKLDLNQAALGSKPIGPPAQFEPAPARAETAAPATAEAVATPPAKPERVAKTPRVVKPRVAASRPSVARPRVAAAKPRVAKSRAVAVAKPRAIASKKLTSIRRNPLDANASAPKVQVWPCRSGGICKWQKR